LNDQATKTAPPAKGQNLFSPWLDTDARPLVEFRDVRKTFGDFTAVDGVSLEIFPREFFALLGPSGCGKTTLLRMLAGFETPTSGQILVDGQDISAIPANQRPINMMFQSYALFPHLSVEANIAFGLKRSKMPKGEIAERTQRMLKLVQMERFAGRKPHQLSGGQRQRVALARSLAKNPKILLLDEPLGALDAKLREQTQFELMNIQETLGTTFIIVTHDQVEAMTVSSRIGLMNHGVLEQVATPADIYENPTSRFSADFIGAVNLIEGISGGKADHGGEAFLEFRAAAEGAGEFLARTNKQVDAGARCWLALRPEKIHVSREKPADAVNAVEGHVDDIAYSGNLSTYYVRLADGAIIKAQEANRRRVANRELTWEDPVWLSWTPGSGVVLTH